MYSIELIEELSSAGGIGRDNQDARFYEATKVSSSHSLPVERFHMIYLHIVVHILARC